MTGIFPRPGWKEVTVAEFEDFLKTCDDYRRGSYVGHSSYYYTHNGKVFAEVEMDDKIERVFIPE